MRVPKVHLFCKPVLVGLVDGELVKRCRCGGIYFWGGWLDRRWFLFERWNAAKQPMEFVS